MEMGKFIGISLKLCKFSATFGHQCINAFSPLPLSPRGSLVIRNLHKMCNEFSFSLNFFYLFRTPSAASSSVSYANHFGLDQIFFSVTVKTRVANFFKYFNLLQF